MKALQQSGDVARGARYESLCLSPSQPPPPTGHVPGLSKLVFTDSKTHPSAKIDGDRKSSGQALAKRCLLLFCFCHRYKEPMPSIPPQPIPHSHDNWSFWPNYFCYVPLDLYKVTGDWHISIGQNKMRMPICKFGHVTFAEDVIRPPYKKCVFDHTTCGYGSTQKLKVDNPLLTCLS